MVMVEQMPEISGLGIDDRGQILPGAKRASRAGQQ